MTAGTYGDLIFEYAVHLFSPQNNRTALVAPQQMSSAHYPKVTMAAWPNNRLDLTRHNGPLLLGAFLTHSLSSFPWRDGQPKGWR